MRSPLLLLLAIATSLAATARPAADALRAGPPLRQPRMAHTATTLRDGSVLIAGGFTDRALAAQSAERFDPTRDAFVALPPMRHPRHSHTATVLRDGRVLLVGGYTADGIVAHAEVFDPRTAEFRDAGAMHERRAGHVAVPLPDGRVLIAGGIGPDWTFLSSAEIYDPRSMRFERTGAMQVPRESHTAVALRDGRVLVIGGHVGRRADLQLHASAELYDVTTGRFTPTGSMRTPRHKHEAVILPSGRVLVLGGSDERDDRGAYTSTEWYDASTGRFTPGPSLTRPRYKLERSARVLPDGDVLVAGGAATAERYDDARDQFVPIPGTGPRAGLFSATALLPDGRVLITGGYGAGMGPQPNTWLYRRD